MAFDEIAILHTGRESDENFGPRSDHPWLVLDFAGSASAPTSIVSDLAAWLPTLPCPVVVLGTPGVHPALAAAADIVVACTNELAAIATTMEAAPITAMTLVQLLRLIETIAPEQALFAESLAYGVLQGGKEFRAWLARRKSDVASPDEDGPAIIVERIGDRLILTLDRPGNRNALSLEMRDALVSALHIAAIDSHVARIELRGNGGSFSIGGDLREFGLFADPAQAHWVRSVRSPAREILRCADRLHVHVQGACIGAGIELAAFARTVTAASNSFFQLPEARMGLLPGSGGCVSVSRRIGRQRTAYLALSGRRISARTALDWGLIDQIVE